MDLSVALNVFRVLSIVIVAMVFFRDLYIIKKYHYQCTRCSTSYKIGFMQNLIQIQLWGMRKLKCPQCKTWEWAVLIKSGLPLQQAHNQ